MQVCYSTLAIALDALAVVSDPYMQIRLQLLVTVIHISYFVNGITTIGVNPYMQKNTIPSNCSIPSFINN